MEPKEFRKKLQKILRTAMTASVVGAAAFTLNCDPPGKTINEVTGDGGVKEALISDVSLPEWAKEAMREITQDAGPDRSFEPLTEGKREPLPEPKPELMPEPRSEPVMEAKTEPIPEPKPELMPEPRPEPTKETVGEKVADHTLKPPPPLTKDCALPQGTQNCGQSGKGVYHRLLTANDPNPLSYQDCLKLCQQGLTQDICIGSSVERYSINPTSCSDDVYQGNQRILSCNYDVQKVCAAVGRRPAGLQEDTPTPLAAQHTDTIDPLREVGEFFAHLAYLEEAAVTAFEYLVKELEAYNAPTELVQIAKDGITEEIEHAKLMQQLALRYGGTLKPVEVEPFALRSLADIAIDNAKEGCIRETFGSLFAMWQSMTSEDEAVKVTMERIAHEESRHGALSWGIDSWIQPLLTEEQRTQCTQARQEAVAQLQSEILQEPSESMQRFAGVPTAAQAQQLYDLLQRETWA
jgi:hypothetical protein